MEAIEDAEACNWSTGVVLGLADHLSVTLAGNVCEVTEHWSTETISIHLFASEVRDLIPALESVLKELKRRGNLADKRYKTRERPLPRES